MSKAATLFCLIFLVATQAIRAQSPSGDQVNAAIDEAIRRQADIKTLGKQLEQAKIVKAQHDLNNAAKLYQDCYLLIVQKIGVTSVEPQYREVVAGLTEVLLERAHWEQEHKNFKAADEDLKRILAIEPRNQIALEAKRENTKLLEQQKGTMPDQETLEMIPTFRTNEIMVGTLVHDGKLLYDAGQLDLAEAKLKKAAAMDPASVAANYYLRLITERRDLEASRIAERASTSGLVEVNKAWDVQARGGKFNPGLSSYIKTNSIHTSKGRQIILGKLEKIHLEDVKFDNLPLTEVINNLSENSRLRDPDKEGVSFFAGRETGSAFAAATGFDPVTGLPAAAAAPEAVDLASINVKISLKNVSLINLLDAITKTADHPIKYSILDYAVMFSSKGPEATPLEIRTYHVDPNTFQQGLESVTGIAIGNIQTSTGSGGGGGGGGGGGNSGGGAGGSTGGTTVLPQVSVTSGGTTGGGTAGGGGGGAGGGAGAQGGIRFVTSRTNATASLEILVRQFFQAAGVDFATNTAGNVGKAVFFNDRKGLLIVRSSTGDLDLIGAALDVLNQAPPQVNIKAKFIEVNQSDNRGLGFQWSLGGVNMAGGNILASGGTQPSLQGTPTSANPVGIFPGTFYSNAVTGIGANTLIAPASSDGALTTGLSNLTALPTLATFTGILTDPQFRAAINALDNRSGVDLLTSPEITTESGRQAQIQAIDLITVVTTSGVNSSSGNSLSGVAGGINSPVVSPSLTSSPGTQVLPFGPVLDVIPYVSADDYSVQMTIIPTITEFLGYDNPGPFVAQGVASGGVSVQAVLPLPHIRLRQVTTSVTVWDGQTLVMGGLITDNVSKEKDKIPMLGDIPFLGRLFQSETSSKTRQNLMIFVTPTILNPDGSRYHSDADLPFALDSIPPQMQKPVNP